MNRKSNHYWMYSQYSIESAILNPKRKILEFLIEKRLENIYRDILQKCNIHKKKINIKIVDKNLIKRKIGSLAKYQGVGLLVEKLILDNYSNLKEKIINKRFILLIDQLNDPINFGSILRVSYAFGIGSIVILENAMVEENGYVASIASGALDKIKIYKITNLVNFINFLKKNGWWVIGLESKNLSNCISIKDNKLKYEKKALVIGSENKGLRNLVSKSCDILYRIPIKNSDLNSINVVQATSIALHELS